MKVRKKPVVVDAWRFDPSSPMPEGFPKEDCVVNLFVCEIDIEGVKVPPGHGYIKTEEGIMIATPMDWIIKGVHGEFYPCKPDIFDKTYDKVE